MNNADRDLMLSSDAQKIKAYCSEFGDQIGLKLEYVAWGMDESPPCPGAPYKLTVKVRPHKLPWDWFMREDIAGYGTGASKARVQEKIRKILEPCL